MSSCEKKSKSIPRISAIADALLYRTREHLHSALCVVCDQLSPSVAEEVRRRVELYLDWKSEGIEPSQQIRVGKWVTHRCLGAGAQGTVWIARNTATGRLCRFKMLWNQQLNELAPRLQHIANLRHANIPRLLNYGQCDKGVYLVFEYAEGLSLTEYLDRKHPSDHKIALLLAQVCDAVYYAHSQDVLHRDIKPSNIRIDRKCHPWLVDFELSTNSVDRFMHSGSSGTIYYCAPEQVSGHPEQLTRYTDIWSLGVVAHEAFTGLLPFYSDDIAELKRQITSASPWPAADYRGRDWRGRRLVEPLSRACDIALRKDPNERFRSAGDMANALRSAIKEAELIAQIGYKNTLAGVVIGALLMWGILKYMSLVERFVAK